MVDNITIDAASASVTHVRGKKLEQPIPLQEWAQHTQAYMALVKRFVMDAYKAQEGFKEELERDPVMKTMELAIGADILDRLQQELGFSLSVVKPTNKWQVPVEEHEVEAPLGKVDLFDLQRVQIVAVCTALLEERTGNPKFIPVERRNDYGLALKQLVNYVVKSLSFPTSFNTRAKVVNEHDTIDEQGTNLYAHYLDNIRDILLQEGWRSLGLEEDPLNEKFLPAGAGVLGCWDCPKDGSRDHPFWTNGVNA